MAIYKDFLGLNYCIYDPCEIDTGSFDYQLVDRAWGYHPGSNTLGYRIPNEGGPPHPNSPWFYTSSVGYGNVSRMTQTTPAQLMVLLNLHRNGNWGYGSWKQIRTSHNHLSRYQRRNNIFTYAPNPGKKYQITINGQQFDHLDRFGKIQRFTEPAVVDSYKPLDLVAGVSVYNPQTNRNEVRSVSIKTTFSNETVFFANDLPNQYYETIVESDESYEDLKALYLNGGLEAAGSPIERFNMLLYRQTVFPKMKYSNLEQTRTRKFYVNTFWRTSRDDRGQKDADNGFDNKIPHQSIWPLDPWDRFTTYGNPGGPFSGQSFWIGGRNQLGWLGLNQANSRGGAGILQNSYAQAFRGYIKLGTGKFRNTQVFTENISEFLTSSCIYSRRHTLKNARSVVAPSGMKITELNMDCLEYPNSVILTGYQLLQSGGIGLSMPTSSIFQGSAFWDAGQQSGKFPFYDSYDDFSKKIRLVGKGYSIVPEFKISSHVKTYQTKGITEELKSIFELSGGLNRASNTEKDPTFYEILSTTDFLKHFDLIKKDHQDFVEPSVLTLKCKAIKKFLPYEGFYPVQRCVQLAQQFFQSYKDFTSFSSSTGISTNYSTQPFLQPLFAPGVLFNTIKSGLAVDFPIFAKEAKPQAGHFNDWGWGEALCSHVKRDSTPVFEGGGGQFGLRQLSHFNNVMWSGSAYNSVWPTGSTTYSELVPNYGDLYSIFTKRIPFEALAEPEQYMKDVDLILQEPHPWSNVTSSVNGEPIGATWNGLGDNLYTKMANNFLAMVPEFFLEGKNFTSISSLESSDPAFGNALAGKFYGMRVKLFRSMDRTNSWLRGFGRVRTMPPQDMNSWPGKVWDPNPGYGQNSKYRFQCTGPRETFTMYSRPSAFGPPIYGGAQHYASGAWGDNRPHGNAQGKWVGIDSMWGYNWAYAPPYYHGEAWCDLIFECTASKKYSVNEIMAQAELWPYQTRFWWNGQNQALRDLTGYKQMTAQPAGSGCDWHTRNVEKFGRIMGPYRTYRYSPWYSLILKGNLGGSKLAQINNAQGAQGGITAYFPSWTKRLDQDTGLMSMPTKWNRFPTEYALSASRLQGNWGNDEYTNGYSVHSGAWAGPPAPLVPLNRIGTTKIRTGSMPYHPYYLNSNAMQLEASLNLFGKGTVKTINLEGDKDTTIQVEVATSETRASKTRWIIQPKFETPMLNFNKYSSLTGSGCTPPLYGTASVPRGMWHQYGVIEDDNPERGIYMQITDIPDTWLKGALAINTGAQKTYVRSLAQLCGFPTKKVKLGKSAQFKQISECVVAVPFIEQEGERKFFTIPKQDIADVVGALKREVEPGVFVAGGPPKTGNTIIEMVRKMKKFVFPPSMDFVRYPDIQPFAMYIFEFTHLLSKKDVTDIWQNLPPDIGRTFVESESSVSHEFLQHELLGKGAVIKNDKLNENAKFSEFPSEIQWMIFKAKKRAKTNYFDKVVARKGTTGDTSGQELENVTAGELGEDPTITYNWPYDYFSLVELIKLDAEITFADVENDDKGNRVLKPIKMADKAEEIAREKMAEEIAKAAGNKKEDK